MSYEMVSRKDGLMSNKHVRHMVMALDDEEWDAIMDLAESLELTPVQVMRQALRAYQLQQAPISKMVLDKKRKADVDSDAAAAVAMLRGSLPRITTKGMMVSDATKQAEHEHMMEEGRAENHHT